MPRCLIYQNIFLAQAKPLHLEHGTYHMLAHLKQNDNHLKYKHTSGVSYHISK